MEIKFITGNQNKVKELIPLIPQNISITHLNINLDEIQGTSEEIIKRKIKDALKLTNYEHPVMVEDTCLCFNALGGFPGPYIKSFYDKLGNEGLAKVINNYEDKTAVAGCIIGLGYKFDESIEIFLFAGMCEGVIVKPGNTDKKTFGWDPIFKPDGYDLTFAEMPFDEKLKLSHRTKALNEFKKWINNPDNLEKFKNKNLETF